MEPATSDSLKKMPVKCSQCQTEITAGEEYHYHSKMLCENCCMDIRMPRVRKTYWQYLRSIKTDYLIPGKKDQSCGMD